MDPTTPRMMRPTLSFPRTGIFNCFSTTKLKTKLKIDRKTIISTAGIWGTNFTETFIIAKNIPAKSMDCTPEIFNFEILGGGIFLQSKDAQDNFIR